MKAKRIIAAGIAAAVLTAFSPLTAGAAEQEKLPDWVPTGYLDAVQFRNDYGAICNDGTYVCIVFRENETNPKDEISRYKVVTTEGVLKEVSHKTLTAPEDVMTGVQYEVVVYQAAEAGDFEVALVDTWLKGGGLDLGYQHAIADYTFSVDEELQIRETDIFSWLPDSISEYIRYNDEHDQISKHGNNIVVCLEEPIGTAYGWESEYDREAVQLITTSDCSQERTQLLDGGSAQKVYVLEAVKDGPVDITYNLVQLYGDAEIADTVEAHFYAFDEGKSLLAPGDARFCLVDADTGEPLPGELVEDQWLGVETDIGYYDEETDEWHYTGPVYLLETNPFVVEQFGNYFHADKFSFWIKDEPIPGYTLPEDYQSVKELGKNMYDITLKLKASTPEPPSDLKPGNARITVVDAETGEPLPASLFEDTMFTISTDIRYKDPSRPGEWMYTGPIYIVSDNPAIFTDFGKWFNADYFSFGLNVNEQTGYSVLDDYQEIQKYSNGSYDITLKVKKNSAVKPNGDISNDGSFSVVDVVALQKWLHHVPGSKAANWQAADFNGDGVLDVFDLALMKRALLRSKKTKTS